MEDIIKNKKMVISLLCIKKWSNQIKYKQLPLPGVVKHFYWTVSGTLKTSGDLAFVSLGNESLNLYEFKVYDTSNNLLKHYIPMKDGRHFYDVLNKTLVDTRKTFEVHRSDLTQNKLAIDIPGLYY